MSELLPSLYPSIIGTNHHLISSPSVSSSSSFGLAHLRPPPPPDVRKFDPITGINPTSGSSSYQITDSSFDVLSSKFSSNYSSLMTNIGRNALQQRESRHYDDNRQLESSKEHLHALRMTSFLPTSSINHRLSSTDNNNYNLDLGLSSVAAAANSLYTFRYHPYLTSPAVQLHPHSRF